MPVQMRHLIPQQLIIELVRTIARLNRLGQQTHFLEIKTAFVGRQIVQLRGVAARDNGR